MDDATASETTPQKPTALQRIWHVTKLVLPHSINIICILFWFYTGFGIYFDIVPNKGDFGHTSILVYYLQFALFFIVTLLLGIFVKNIWVRRLFRYLSPLLFIGFISLMDFFEL